MTAITGITRLKVTVTGRADHAGTTPMSIRRDALSGAARMVSSVERAAHSVGAPAVATVGMLSVHPGQINVVPERATFTVELRHPDRQQQVALRRRIEKALRAIAYERGLGLEMQLLHDHLPVPMDPGVVLAVTAAALEVGCESVAMPSGAGHDAQILAARFRTGMVFVPSAGGRSHSPEEFTDPRLLELGCKVLAGTLRRLAYGT